MPPFARWTIRCSLVCLALSWLLELWRMAQPHFVPVFPWAQRAAVFHLFFVGWLTQLIFGVAHWMFPTQSREKPRGSEGLAMVVLVLLNLGVALRIAAEPMVTASPRQPVWATLLVTAGLLQWLAALLFAIHIWPRVRGRRRTK